MAFAGCDKRRADTKTGQGMGAPRTLSSFDPPAAGDKLMAAQTIKFEQAELGQVLKLYAEVSGRSIIWGGNLPDVKINFSNQAPMAAVEVLQALDTTLAAQGVTTVFLGTQYVKVVPTKEAPMEPGPVIELPADQLPESSSFLIYIVRLKHLQPHQVAQALQPFCKLPNSIIGFNSAASQPPSKAGLPKLPSSIFGPNENHFVILRDYSSNVRRMLQVLEKIDQ